MIVNLHRFLERRRPVWSEFERRISAAADAPFQRLELDDLRRLIELYEEVAADLADVRELGGESELRAYLEALVARAHAEIHALREPAVRWRPGRWFAESLPAAIRRRWRAGTLAIAIYAVGAAFGAAALIVDPSAREQWLPFDHLRKPPAERVELEQREMSARGDRDEREYRTFAAWLWVNNVRVSLLLLALGMTFGVGTAAVLTLNGMLLGAVAADFVVAGQTRFLLGWLLPHGAVEIPAIWLAGQAGFTIGGALLGTGAAARPPLAERLGAVRTDVLALIGAAAALLIWAAVVESFLSQHHEPRLPYGIKIAIGVLELSALGAYLWRVGRAGREATRG